MKMSAAFVFFVFLLGAAPGVRAGEASVVFAVSHYDRQGSYGQCRSTEVFTVSASGGTPVRVFSDAASYGFKLPCLDGVDNGYNLIAVNPRTHVLYARVYIFDAKRDVQVAIAEFSLDGSGHHRKLIVGRNVEAADNIFVNSGGDEIGTWDGSKFSFFDAETGAHLSDPSTRELSELLEYKCDIGNVIGVGWLDHDQKVFLTLGDPSAEDEDDPETKLLGTWAMGKNGSNLKRIGPPPGAFTIPGYRFYEHEEFSAKLLGQTADGDDVFIAEMQKIADPASGPADFLSINHPVPAINKPGSKTKKTVPATSTSKIVPTDSTSKIVATNPSGTETMGISLSPAGDFVAYATAPVDADGAYFKSQPNPAVGVYVQPLTGDPPKQLTSYVPEAFQSGETRLWLIGWLEN